MLFRMGAIETKVKNMVAFDCHECPAASQNHMFYRLNNQRIASLSLSRDQLGIILGDSTELETLESLSHTSK